MLRRIFPLAGALLTACALAVPAFAKPHVVFQKTEPGNVFASRGLIPGHRYQLQVSSAKGHVKFTGAADEFYTYTSTKSFGSGNKNLTFSGTTPKSITVDQPVKLTLLSWLLSVQVNTRSLGKVTLKYVDMGKHK